jgi:hypothetical protein
MVRGCKYMLVGKGEIVSLPMVVMDIILLTVGIFMQA